jgi:uncharacterized membrane protein
MENQKFEENRIKKDYKNIQEFMVDFPDLSEDEAKEIFPLLENLKECRVYLKVIAVKLKVLQIAKHVLTCCILLMLPSIFFPLNLVNFWFLAGAGLITILTGIFVPLFMKFYGRRKK